MSLLPLPRRQACARIGFAAALSVALLLAVAPLLPSRPARPADSPAADAGRAGPVASHAPAAPAEPDAATRARLSEAYGKLPLSFEANRGQADAAAKFLARGQGYTLLLTSDGAVLSLRNAESGLRNQESADSAASAQRARPDEVNPQSTIGNPQSAVLRLKLAGARRAPVVKGLDELAGKSNYFVGADPSRWRTGVPSFARVEYEQVYEGVDLVYYGNQRQLEYDFRVAAGADASRIALAFEGARRVSVDDGGDLVLHTAAGDVRQQKPFAYQEIEGARREVASGYVLDGGLVKFRLGDYDRTRPLVIDPVLLYSTYLGGGGSLDEGRGIAVDAAGSAYVTGATSSVDFPGPSPIQSGKDGSSNDAFVAKLNPSGTGLVYATYLGGSAHDIGNAVAVDAAGNAYVAGTTESANFPRTAGALQQSKGGFGDSFVAKINAAGSALVYSTFLGGNVGDQIFGIAVDSSGSAYVAGFTDSTDIPAAGLFDARAGSALFKTLNGGAAWGRSEAGLASSLVNALAFAPNDAATLYAATRNGVFKSTDGGGLWRLTGQVNPPTASQFVNAVAVDPLTPTTVYAASFSGIAKSTNGGDSYEARNNGLPSFSVNALLVDPAAPQTLYAGTSQGLVKSTNGGDNWLSANNGLRESPSFPSPLQILRLAFDPNNSATVYAGTHRGVYKTTNGAANWTSINNGFSQLPRVNALAVDPTNSSVLYLGSTGFPLGVFKSTDGGANWTSASNGLTVTNGGVTFTPFVNALALDPAAPSTVYAATTNGGVFKSTDGGANWSPANGGLTNLTVLALAVDPSNPARVYAGASAGGDAFVAKLNPEGSALAYFRYLGGSEGDDARAIAVDSAGNAYLTGGTNSRDFPLAGALQPSTGGSTDAFATKVNAAGTALVYSTYLGGGASDSGRGVAVDAAGSAYLTGVTASANFPVANAFKSSHEEGSTNAFVTKLSPDGAGLVYSTYLGGEDFNDQGFGIAVDAAGSAYVTGFASSNDFPLVNPTQAYKFNDAFVTKFSPDGAGLVYSTYFGGDFTDQGNAIAVDRQGNAYVTGSTTSSNLPTANPLQPSLKGFGDAFVVKLGSEADLSITKTDSRDPVMVNNRLTYTLRVTNHGPGPAGGVVAADTLPASLAFVSATPSQGACGQGGGTVTCQLGGLAPGASATVQIVVTPTAVGPVSNTASVRADEPDNNPSNNTGAQATNVSSLPSIAGRVTGPGGEAFAGVEVRLTGTRAATALTDADGFYQFADLPAGGSYTVAPLRDGFSFGPLSRSFDNLSADQTADFAASTCTFALSPASHSGGAQGGAGSVNVTTLDGCRWTASSESDWITVTSGASGVGSGTVNFTFAPTARARAGRLNVAGLSFPVYQEFESCGAPAFTIANYRLGSSSTVTQIADLNGDGHNDIVAATTALSGGGIQATVLLNDGTGRFTPSNFDARTGTPQGFALGDFNGDARPDIAMTNYNSPTVVLHYNNGSGGFGQSFAEIAFGQQSPSPLTRGLKSTDFNRDGRADLVISTPGTDSVRLLPGDGAGGFGATISVNVGNDYLLFEVADLNSDGNTDLILGGHDFARLLTVMLGDGRGNFTAPAAVTGSGQAYSVAPADFDGDGKLDLAVATSVTTNSFFPNLLLIMAGDGAGGFTLKHTFNAGTAPVGRLAVADLNSDAKPDIAYTTQGHLVAVLLGDGVGGLGPPIFHAVASETPFPGVSGIAAGDFNGDARPDLSVIDYTRGAWVLTNTCAGAPRITGRVTTGDTAGLGGVQISLGGAQNATTHTDAGGNYAFENLAAGASYVVTPSKENYRFSPASASVNDLAGNRTANFTATPITLQLERIHYLAEEGAGSVQINVNRTGDASGVSTVDYATVGLSASERSDYTAAVGTLRFAPGETVKGFKILLTDDRLVEGFESLRVTLSNPRGALVGTNGTASALMEIRDNDSDPGAANPIGDPPFFVRQHYADFLNREADAAGLAFWTGQITECGSNAQCVDLRRTNVSAAFFLSIEFQQTGYLVYRTHQAAFGVGPLLRISDFLPDTQEIGRGVVVGVGDWERQLEANKQAYVNDFTQRPQFLAAYPQTLTAAQFVDALNQNTGGSLSQAERDQLINELSSGAKTRAQVLRAVVEDVDFNRREFNRAFVLMQYFGYLRRNPTDAPDGNLDGYNFWLSKLNQFNGNFVAAEMVKAFIVSGEYRGRFAAR